MAGNSMPSKRRVASWAALTFLLLAAPPAARADALRGDPTHGQQIYARCQACHSIERNRIGPMHKGLFGRRAGSVPGFVYSAAMRNSGIVWSEATLDRFLQGPRQMVPGTKMTYAGVPDPQERADLIAYLRQATNP
jgi:cytochrome c